ncbi:hypothetical protein SLS55_002011 [Diplodia seriata]|uniref:Heterokaryon incompatibility domain-containing protein n=1 Tax=Diplodia seriata TaxID=420778 RepID=A0ABR3CQZ0_9PEZI
MASKVDVASKSRGPHFAVERSWLYRCLDKHKICEQDLSSNEPPRRLVQLKTNGYEGLRPRLVDTRKQRDGDWRWCCLSYCWGGDQPVKATNATIQLFQDEIPVEELPKTIYDAMVAARELGMAYIWIDCLCIIQDDELDKAWEISRMPWIYHSAVFTIAVSSAASSTEGFLSADQEDDASKQTRRFHLNVKCPSTGAAGEFAITEGRQFDSMSDPLYGRGWAFQEYVLSTRVIEYSSAWTAWYCAACFETDQGFHSEDVGYFSSLFAGFSRSPGRLEKIPRGLRW